MELVALITMGSIILFLGILNIVQLKDFRKERKEANKEKQELINKLMSRNFTEYSSGYSYMNPPEESAPTEEDLVYEAMRKEEESVIPVGN